MLEVLDTLYIALALAVIFRKRIGQVLENMFSSIDENSTKGMSNTTSFEGN